MKLTERILIRDSLIDSMGETIDTISDLRQNENMASSDFIKIGMSGHILAALVVNSHINEEILIELKKLNAK